MRSPIFIENSADEFGSTRGSRNDSQIIPPPSVLVKDVEFGGMDVEGEGESELGVGGGWGLVGGCSANLFYGVGW